MTDVQKILKIVKQHMFKPKQTLARNEYKEAIVVPLGINEVQDLSDFTEEEKQLLINNDGWDVATLEQVYQFIMKTASWMASSHGGQSAPPPMSYFRQQQQPLPPQQRIYPQLNQTTTLQPQPQQPIIVNPIPAPAPAPATNNNNSLCSRYQICDIGSLQGVNDENLVFFYPSHTLMDKTKLLSVVLNFSNPVVGEYKVQMVNALNTTSPPRDIHKFTGTKSNVIVISLSEVLTTQNSVYFKMTPTPVDAKGNRPLIRMQVSMECSK
ncbi:hypothetical protein [Trichoplusia ni ascovirus 2c]|uniref:Uncharacterized protein ORF148 n=1 Tax=Trichoplusia ni ascovirus 2c TaxID=328615 RepID=Y148_TNAVC|nr:hypothetical protein TNAV2c_gp148 [Trichoplusia ni ascovirus 2c]Q06VD5.1 RecName: Full=Uncharacterized protein ORF148 [Trichoplusia ni ascovirus 2c]ABF70664.1 hypothetical protein [Trichoplusia ni ascovirus 2c]AUS94255.1 hypothetical protein [Trichoplusia ni ascovirus 6b]